MTKPKLTPKQAQFIKGIAKGKTQTEAYKEAYDVSPETKISTIHEEASRTASLPQVSNAIQQLFSLDKTQQVVENLHKLAISAEDEKVQHDATKTWLDRAIGSSSKDNNNTFIQINNDLKGKYE